MAVRTPDLAPGARQRVWVLLLLTSLMGICTYAAFGRTEILWISVLVLGVLSYLLLGVSLTQQREEQAIAPLLKEVVKSQDPNTYWVLLDMGGVVLHLTDAGCKELRHNSDVLVGQRLADLIPLRQTQGRVALVELLRFGSLQRVYDAKLPLLSEEGHQHVHRLSTVPLLHQGGRSALWTALGPTRPASIEPH
jgi:hypothetical protein